MVMRIVSSDGGSCKTKQRRKHHKGNGGERMQGHRKGQAKIAHKLSSAGIFRRLGINPAPVLERTGHGFSAPRARTNPISEPIKPQVTHTLPFATRSKYFRAPAGRPL